MASAEALPTLWNYTSEGRLTLSYASFQSELCLWEFNQQLITQKTLVLPRVDGNRLRLYRVRDLSDLHLSSWGIAEPDPCACDEIAPALIDTVFVPGLAFDPCHHRLGYGKGFYDRLLSECRTEILSVGVGFSEQYLEEMLPVHPGDKSLKFLELF